MVELPRVTFVKDIIKSYLLLITLLLYLEIEFDIKPTVK